MLDWDDLKPILWAFVRASLLGVAFGWLCVQGCKLVLREAAEIRSSQTDR